MGCGSRIGARREDPLSLWQDYRRSLKLVEVEEFVDLAIYRPLGYLFVKAIYRTSVTPNQISVFAIFVGLLAGFCYGLGHRPAVIAAGVLFAFSIVLDCADGQLARLKKNGTRLGRILDGVGDYIVDLSVCAGIAVGAAPEGRLAKWTLLVAAAVVSFISHSIALDYYRTRYLNIVVGGGNSMEEEDDRIFREELAALRQGKGHTARKAVLALYLRYAELQKRMTRQKNVGRSFYGLDPEEFRRRNKAALRGWTFLGSSLANTWIIITTLIDRIDLFFWGLIVVANIWGVIMYVVQSRIDQRIAQEAVS
jgi:phosphatidylglycerophosphate synthase